jgi:hypothetical protein
MGDKKYEPAYFTLEASLIFPMVLLFTSMMIFLAFYSYDRCIMQLSAYEAALRGASNHYESASEAESVAQSAAAVLINDKLFAMKDFKYSVEVDASKVTVNYHCIVNMPFKSWLGGYTGGFSDKLMTIDVSASASRLHQARTIRQCRVLNKLIKE